MVPRASLLKAGCRLNSPPYNTLFAASYGDISAGTHPRGRSHQALSAEAKLLQPG